MQHAMTGVIVINIYNIYITYNIYNIDYETNNLR